MCSTDCFNRVLKYLFSPFISSPVSTSFYHKYKMIIDTIMHNKNEWKDTAEISTIINYPMIYIFEIVYNAPNRGKDTE